MGIFTENHERNRGVRLNAVRCVGEYLWFRFFQETEKISKAIMRFCIKEGKEKGYDGRVDQYVLPFQTTFPPKKTTNGNATT